MLVSLLAAMSMAINAEHIKYTPEDDDFWYYLTWIFHTRFKTAIYVAPKTRHANFELRMEELT